MSKRKKRRRSEEATERSEQHSNGAHGDKPDQSSAAISPPKRNLAMLSISAALFAMWIAFLVYVAFFG